VSYSIIFWGNSSHSSVNFKMQKRVIRIIMGGEHGESCSLQASKSLMVFPRQLRTSPANSKGFKLL